MSEYVGQCKSNPHNPHTSCKKVICADTLTKGKKYYS